MAEEDQEWDAVVRAEAEAVGSATALLRMAVAAAGAAAMVDHRLSPRGEATAAAIEVVREASIHIESFEGGRRTYASMPEGLRGNS